MMNAKMFSEAPERCEEGRLAEPSQTNQQHHLSISTSRMTRSVHVVLEHWSRRIFEFKCLHFRLYFVFFISCLWDCTDGDAGIEGARMLVAAALTKLDESIQTPPSLVLLPVMLSRVCHHASTWSLFMQADEGERLCSDAAQLRRRQSSRLSNHTSPGRSGAC